MNLDDKVSIIIPFYQKEGGILTRALKSVISQRSALNYEVIIVDDSSPSPVEMEINTFTTNQRNKIRLIKQSNQGPSAAKNTGIANVNPDTKYIAFLNSDDTWLEHHLENAVTALNKGYDYYFSDYFVINESRTAALADNKSLLNLSSHRIVDPVKSLFLFQGSMLDQIIMRGNIAATPTIVYRYQKLKSLTFIKSLHIGEDCIFSIEASKVTSNIIFSLVPSCQLGKGINI